MIYESEPWKEEIIRISDRLERRYNQRQWSERSFFNLEKEVFLGLFSMRKLMESNKVADAVTKQKIELAVYPAGNKHVTLLNQDKLSELYDLYAGKKEKLTYRDICNQFIHRSIFAPFTPNGKSLVGFFIASDKVKKKELYYIQLKVIVEILRNVGNDHPSQFKMNFDEKKKEYAISIL